MNMAQEFGYKKALGISTIPRAKCGSGRRIRITFWMKTSQKYSKIEQFPQPNVDKGSDICNWIQQKKIALGVILGVKRGHVQWH